MTTDDVVAIGRLLSDATRVTMLDALFDGRAYTVNELARHAHVAPSTASEHLGRLLDGRLVASEAQGRHRYYRLAGPHVAELLESLFEFGTHTPLRSTPSVPADLAFARTCYDHLAGTVAVELTDHLITTGPITYVDTVPHLTSVGQRLFAPLGLPASRSASRPVLRRCLDWSERRPHLAGALPASLLDHMLTERWVARRQRRALQLTEAGRVQLAATLGFEAPQQMRRRDSSPTNTQERNAMGGRELPGDPGHQRQVGSLVLER